MASHKPTANRRRIDPAEEDSDSDRPVRAPVGQWLAKSRSSRCVVARAKTAGDRDLRGTRGGDYSQQSHQLERSKTTGLGVSYNGWDSLFGV
jgi:hypothetical protein